MAQRVSKPVRFPQRLIIDCEPPAVVARWAPHFNKVKELILTDSAVNHNNFYLLIPYVSLIPQLSLTITRFLRHFFTAPATTAFSHAFQRLTHLAIDSPLTLEGEQALLQCFSHHFPNLLHFSFCNRGKAVFPVYHREAIPPSLVALLSSLPHLTHLQLRSETLLPYMNDSLLIAISQNCHSVTDLNVGIGATLNYTASITQAGVTALASGCKYLATIHVQDWHIRPDQLNIILSLCTSLTHLHISPLTAGDIQLVNAILAAHVRVTHLTVTDLSSAFNGEEANIIRSPHIRTLTLSFTNCQDIHCFVTAREHLARNPAVADITIANDKDVWCTWFYTTPPPHYVTGIVSQFHGIRKVTWRETKQQKVTLITWTQPAEADAYLCTWPPLTGDPFLDDDAMSLFT